jgi:GntR family transcriptional regulator, transcriptional repressor for pyruvate dehydrogenase complex
MTIKDRPQKIAMIVAQRIMSDVSRLGMEPGDLLPPERLMLKEYEIGRGTLREALRLLEFQGAIALKPGPGGGPILLEPDASHLGSTLLLLMQVRKVPYRTVVEVRQALEPFASRLAAKRITPEALTTLGNSITRMREGLQDEREFLAANRDFHDTIAWASGNAMLGYFNESLLGIMDGTAIGFDYPARRRTAILKAHEEILEAMVREDADQAEERMQAHVDAYVVYAEKKFPELLNRIIQWDHSLQG